LGFRRALSANVQLSTKVALSISLVVAAVGAVATSVALESQARAQRAEFERKSTEALELLTLAVAPAISRNEHHHIQGVIDNVANFRDKFHDVEDLEVLDQHGRVLAALDPTRYNDVVASPAAQRDLALDEGIPEWESDGRLRVVAPVKVSHKLGAIRGWFTPKRSLAPSIRRQQQHAGLFVLGTMILIALSLYLVLERLVAVRLRALARAARALGRGEKDVSAADGAGDEIGALGRSFNAMARALGRYTDDLEGIIRERTDELERANERLERLAITDQLTGLCNRRHFDECARRALEVARRNERPLALVLADTDRFKTVNDRFGHGVGDRVLRAVAMVLERTARKSDLVARIGGEEFAVLMPEVGVGLAAQGAERMRAALEAEVSIQVAELDGEPVTASFGVAAFEHHDERLEDLVTAADAAMYRSKSAGRNRVTVAEERQPAAVAVVSKELDDDAR
jgi:diguanylate cyclase (GGDEF)-like protein